jgi:hypothetical protein
MLSAGALPPADGLSAGAPDGLSTGALDGSGAVLGAVVADGLLQAATEPATAPASVNANRTRFNIRGTSVWRAGLGHCLGAGEGHEARR